MADVCPKPPVRPFWTVGQIARRVGLSARTIERYCDDGLLSCTRTPGNHRRIPSAAVDAFLRQFAATG